jgi:hypothetical protein
LLHNCIDFLWYKLGLSIFGSVRFWTKINNQTDFILFLFLEPNRTENWFKPINFSSVRFGFSPFQTGSNRNFYTCFHFSKNQLQFLFCSPCPEVKPNKKNTQNKRICLQKNKEKIKSYWNVKSSKSMEEKNTDLRDERQEKHR